MQLHLLQRSTGEMNQGSRNHHFKLSTSSFFGRMFSPFSKLTHSGQHKIINSANARSRLFGCGHRNRPAPSIPTFSRDDQVMIWGFGVSKIPPAFQGIIPTYATRVKSSQRLPTKKLRDWTSEYKIVEVSVYNTFTHMLQPYGVYNMHVYICRFQATVIDNFNSITFWRI